MRAWIIADAAKAIDARQVALAWLEEHGVKLTGYKQHSVADDATVTVTLNFAGGCPGAKEAAAVMSSYSRLNLPLAVKHAIECCRNDIAIHTETIRKELSNDRESADQRQPAGARAFPHDQR